MNNEELAAWKIKTEADYALQDTYWARDIQEASKWQRFCDHEMENVNLSVLQKDMIHLLHDGCLQHALDGYATWKATYQSDTQRILETNTTQYEIIRMGANDQRPNPICTPVLQAQLDAWLESIIE